MSSQPKKKRVALKLLLLLLICVGPMIAAVFMYQARDTLAFTSKNQGTLVIPSVSLETFGVAIPGKRRWMLAYYTPEACNASCQEVLSHFNTMELSLSKDHDRIGSVLLSPNPIDKTTVPLKPSGLIQLQTNEVAPPEHLLPAPDSNGIWLIDPLGNIILRYDNENLDNRMLLDLRYLLKVSQIG